MITPEIKSLPDEDICILLRFDNHSGNYVCDCGDASLLTVRDCQDTKAIFISHTHIDHFVNFDFFLRHQIGTGNNVVVCGPAGITEQLKNRISSYTWNLIEAQALSYEIREIVGPGRVIVSHIKPPQWEIESLADLDSDVIYSNEKFAVQFAILDHKTPSICYKFQEESTTKIDISKANAKPGKWVSSLKNAFENRAPEQEIEVNGEWIPAGTLFHLLAVKPGASLGVIMDHAASVDNHRIIQKLFLNCDQVFIETYYKAEDKALADQNHHSYTTASAKVMRLAKVKQAIPVHFSRKYAEEEIAEIVAEFERALNPPMSQIKLE